jgi:hypothetical protein
LAGIWSIQYQCPYGLRRTRPSRRAARIGPSPPDQVGVLAQQGPRGNDQTQLAETAAEQQPGQRGQDRPVGPGQPRCPDLALKHGDLVAQDEDLSILGTVRPGEQCKPAEHAEQR